MKIMIINGPNLNLLGSREPALYGSKSLSEINQGLRQKARALGMELDFIQSNHEGALIDALHTVGLDYDGAIVNAGAYTHTSLALRDAVLAINKPVVEVHLSNPAARERFRHRSLLAGAVAGVIAGFGEASYHLALQWLRMQAAE